MSRLSPPVLVTSAVRASASKTGLNGEVDRLRETIVGVKRWIQTPGVKQIVVCDGSGFDLGPYLEEVRGRSEIQLESLSFVNNVGLVQERGKGWGEGEIIKYALESSSVLAGSTVFAKCTGKLWVANYLDCLDGFDGRASFDFNGVFAPVFIDTRFYMVEKDFYIRHLMSAYQDVRDDRGFYLEHAFLRALRDFRLSDYLMYPTPRIFGVSGSMGSSYRPSEIKARLRDVRSRLLQVIG